METAGLKQRQTNNHRRRSQMGAGGCYTFSSRPTPLGVRPKFRDPQAERTQTNPSNIMHDPRVVRGSTYARQNPPMKAPPGPVGVIRRKRKFVEQPRSVTPEPLPGRIHMNVQTEKYLEELMDVIETNQIESQTDAFKDRPASPLYIPSKTGVDVATQIEDGELFDFDTEVKPIVDILVGKTLEQSLMEVMHEEELACLRVQQRIFEDNRNFELAEVQRLEEAERRRNAERARRLAQQMETLRAEKELAEKIAAKKCATNFLTNVLPKVYDSLRTDGYYYDPVQNDIETNFIPWMMSEVDVNMERRRGARLVLEELIHNAAQKRMEAIKEARMEASKEEGMEASKEEGMEASKEEGMEASKEEETQPPAETDS